MFRKHTSLTGSHPSHKATEWQVLLRSVVAGLRIDVATFSRPRRTGLPEADRPAYVGRRTVFTNLFITQKLDRCY